MNSAHTLILAVVCILAGAALTALNDNSTSGVMLVTAGAGTMTVAMQQQRQETRAVVKKAHDKAQEAIEETQTLRRDMMSRD